MMNIGWVTGMARRGGGLSPPGSALSLLREINFDSFTGKLIANPVPELALLHNATLFSTTTMPLQPLARGGGSGGATVLPLAPSGAGHTADLSAQFSLHPSVPTSFGVSVLAHVDNISESTTVRVAVSAPDSRGVYRGVVHGRVELAEGECPWEDWWECAHPACLKNRSAPDCPSLQKARAPRPRDLGWNGSFSLTNEHFVADCEGSLPCITVRILIDRSLVEVFVAGGQVSALMAYEPPSLTATQVHMFTEPTMPLEAAVGVAARVQVHSMGCGWNDSSTTTIVKPPAKLDDGAAAAVPAATAAAATLAAAAPRTAQVAIEPWGTDSLRIRIALSGAQIWEDLPGALVGPAPGAESLSSHTDGSIASTSRRGNAMSNGNIKAEWSVRGGGGVLSVTRVSDGAVLIESTRIQMRACNTTAEVAIGRRVISTRRIVFVWIITHEI
jgi:hypothetical protein